MSVPEVDFLRPENRIGYEPPRQRRGKFFVFFLFLVLVIFIGSKAIVAYRMPAYGSEKQSFLGRLTSLVWSGGGKLKGESADRVNILLLGIGGPGHEGPFLTDTMILASIRPKEKDLALVSIPRDLLAEVPGVGFRKINEVYAFGEVDKPGSGGDAAREALAEILDMPIDYYMRIDFAGFKKAIDDLGGVIIDVPQSFYDPLYPDSDFGYQTIGFKSGRQLMDGARALQFVRSRHGTGGEGSDFARSRRQQLLMLALKERVLSVSTLANPGKVFNILDNITEHFKTNMDFVEMTRAAAVAKDLDYAGIHRYVLAEGEGYPLVAEMRDGAYVLVPKAGDWSEVREVVKNVFLRPAGSDEDIKKFGQKVVIEVQNGTNISGLAYQASLKLTELGFEIGGIKNALHKDFDKTVIYDFSGGKYKDSLIKIRANLDANVGIDAPVWIKSELDDPARASVKPDFIIIIGKSAS